MTFPASEAQLPRPILPGSDSVEPSFTGRGEAGQSLTVDYDIEGADVGYRWYARRGLKPLFPFGFGLSYTSFASSNLKLTTQGTGLSAELTVRNTGARDGADIAQLYLTGVGDQSTRRLVAYQRIELAAGASSTIHLAVDPRLLAHWESNAWHIAGGSYRFAIGRSACELGPESPIRLSDRRWRDRG